MVAEKDPRALRRMEREGGREGGKGLLIKPIARELRETRTATPLAGHCTRMNALKLKEGRPFPLSDATGGELADLQNRETLFNGFRLVADR